MRILSLAIAVNVCLWWAGAGAASAQSPTPSVVATTQSPTATPTPDLSTPTPSQTPVVPAVDTMRLRGIVPVPAGSTVIVEALDPATIRGVECARTQTTPIDDGTAASAFILNVPGSCVSQTSGNLRLCWGPPPELCQGIEFIGGITLDLGTLARQTPQVFAPDAGSGAVEQPGGPSTSWLPELIALGLAGALCTAAALVKLKQARRS